MTLDAPVCLYAGKVMHARMRPKAHRFTYKMTSMLIDLDRLAEADKASPLFSVNRANIVSFSERHHGPRDGRSLRGYVDMLCRKAGLSRPARVRLLCYPAILGYVFNPISVYFCEGDDGEITALIYQVHNTFGESHSYVEPVLTGQLSEAGIRQERDKGLHVSPFLGMGMRYFFRVRPPLDNVAIRILEKDHDGPILAASFHGERRETATSSLILAILQMAGITWKVTAAIHFEAFRLWLKGIRLHPRPTPPPETSIAGTARERAHPLPGE